MSDFDHYFSDDLVLDESTLAVLDAEENRFNQTQQHPRPSQPVPPPKRQKTDQGWKHTTQSDTFDEDLPEISISHDGTYGLLGQATVPNTFRAQTPVAAQNRVPARIRPPAPVPSVSRPSSQPQRRQPTVRQPPPRNAQPPPPSSRSFGQHGSQNSNSNQNRRQPPTHAAPSRASVTNTHVQPLGEEMTALRRQLEEMNRSYEDTRQALKAAQDAQFAKEGEVSILRKNIEKTAQDHSANLTKLRTAKEAAESMQAQIRKEMRDEIERVKTQFTFKQHELESSVRKPPWSIRAKKIPPTPLNMNKWNQPDFSVAGPSNVKKTPSRPRIADWSSPGGRRATLPPRSSQMLPGFVNAFQPSSPTKSQEPPRPTIQTAATNNEPVNGRGKTPSQPRRKLSPQSSPTASQHEPIDITAEDTFDGNTYGLEDEESVEDFDQVEPINWAAELHHVIFTHTSTSSANSTVQTLMSVTLPPASPQETLDLFSRAATELWTILSSVTAVHQLPMSYLYGRVSNSLTRMAWVLNVVDSIPALTAVLGLLKDLLFFVSSFAGPLLSTNDDAQDSRVVGVLCEVVRNQLVPSTDIKVTSKMTLKQRQRELDPTRAALAQEVLGLFEALCWTAPDGQETRLAPFIRGDQILDVLLDSRQPSWFIHRAVRGLVLFASRSGLFRHLLSFPENLESDKEQDYSKIPQIERLFSYLADDSRCSKEAEMARNGILTLVSTLSIAHADARTILLESDLLIPSLVARLTHLTSLLWEDDEELMSSPDLTNSTTRSLCQTLFLLHDFVFNTHPTLDLKQKIQHANPATGIDHMFNVTFGRLTYAPDLVWVPEETARCLTQVTETAREILQVVVDGVEEEDMIYEAYQEEEPDDEEMEAMQLEANEL